ncbi:Sec-independent protein translocase protein TatB [Arsenophonus nasoniae]|uniref:Sec-independent protein translocase protein TatB n=1 Tax=Arsenophonus nasoniae TaxID=638 RepID=D2TWP8_9GAMM|nr:Sec-independent protein translocase protein TatB [Arsenophonus nasoniae]QBY45177.1 Sec-independent protein translocase protein TatB [Arsenophonus nasoniae]WGM01183.1 Sec-independent protein translocase protein TatB [Arsenophonus nasoniae]WGM05368.1 Sec-independent protein translocase protein TatB [Arsenophonus nasoniae]WGM10376.1 Sec-independent protein translocase protein TatB [Arsenophonus nasoniae]WGM15088.1 Sec-independent protein translocase protein TatB [Arsenophonus nasoniae]
MLDIGFSELLLVMIIGLVVLGPERLPIAVKTVAGWIRALRSLAANVQHELSQELKLQELQETLKKAEEKAQLQTLSPELKQSMEELRESTELLKKNYQSSNSRIEEELAKVKAFTSDLAENSTAKIDEEIPITAHKQHKPAQTEQLVTESGRPTKNKKAPQSPAEKVKKHSDQTNGEN